MCGIRGIVAPHAVSRTRLEIIRNLEYPTDEGTLYTATMGNAEEVKAREGSLIGSVTDENGELFDEHIRLPNAPPLLPRSCTWWHCSCSRTRRRWRSSGTWIGLVPLRNR